METSFFAKQVSATDEEWGRLVLFGSIEEMDGQPYLMFQGAYEYSPQDIHLGQNKPYVEIGDQGWSWYGHIKDVTLERSRLSLQMDQEARTLMQNDGQFTVHFEINNEAFGQLSEKLQQIFTGFEGFRANVP